MAQNLGIIRFAVVVTGRAEPLFVGTSDDCRRAPIALEPAVVVALKLRIYSTEGIRLENDACMSLEIEALLVRSF